MDYASNLTIMLGQKRLNCLELWEITPLHDFGIIPALNSVRCGVFVSKKWIKNKNKSIFQQR